MNIYLILATDENGGIGFQNQLPWHFKSDLKYFAKMTKGLQHDKNAICMGRKTWDSLPRKPLPGRENIVLSRSLQNDHSVASLEDCFVRCREKNINNLWIIGGKSLYDIFINDTVYRAKLSAIYHTKIRNKYECDVFVEPIWEQTNSGWYLASKTVITESVEQIKTIEKTTEKDSNGVFGLGIGEKVKKKNIDLEYSIYYKSK